MTPSTAAAPDTRYRELFDSAPVALYVAAPDGILLACNGALARLLGFADPAEAAGRSLADFYAGTAFSDFVERLRRVRRVDEQRNRLRRADGAYLDVIEMVAGEFDDQDRLLELRGALVDVTARLQAEASLQERERQFRAVFSQAADAMLILDDRRAVLEANPAAGALFGGSAAALVGRRLDELFADGDELAAAWRELLALGEAKREHRIASATGTHLVECSYRARVQVDRHLCIARDITDRRLLEERVMQSEKIESVGRLAGGIAHDFNNLLTAILGYTELLINSRRPDDAALPDLQEIQRAGSRAAALTQQLLAFSRKQVLMPKEVDLNAAVLGLEAMLTRLIREDITLECHVADTPAFVRIDPNQIEQVILNLVLNARDAMPDGGRIRIDVARVRASEATLPIDYLNAPGEYVRLRVTDTGVGIPPEVRAHLFEPFFTTKELGKGTGLGLASVYGIVQQSSGHIDVESEERVGTTFTMHFPAIAAAMPAERPAVEAPPRVVEPSSETILLVEDEDAVRVIISAVLRRQGYQVLEASTPRGACDIFEQHGQEVDLLLTDVVMPEMNGPALAQRLVAVRPELRVLFISGYADMAMPLDSDNPNISFLGKPFQASVLTGKVREILSRPRRP
jgi:PAS domain S-box-containing protein